MNLHVTSQDPMAVLNSIRAKVAYAPATARDAHAQAVEVGTIWQRERQNILPVLNAAGDNTIDATLKRTVVMQEILTDFKRRVLDLTAFSVVFRDVPLEGSATIDVPFLDLDASASQDFQKGTGYATIGETTVDSRTLTISNRKYQALSFTSEEFLRQPALKLVELARAKSDKLASDIVADVLSVITLANYGAAAKSEAADGFDSDDVADLVTACKTWPDFGRSLFLDTAFHVALLKDNSFKAAYAAGSDSAIKEGRLFPRVLGFDYHEAATIPGNSENLVGFCAHQSAILAAFCPVAPCAEVVAAGTRFSMAVDPASGVTLSFRSFGNPTLDSATWIVESSYGYAKGNGSALKRITSG